MTEKVLVRIDDDGNATVMLNRPEVHNAFDPEMVEGLTVALEELDEKEAVRAVVLVGAGESFSAGADIAHMKKSAGYSRKKNFEAAHATGRMLYKLLGMLVWKGGKAFLRLKISQKLYGEQQNGVTFLTPALFRAAIPIPDNAPTGSYEIDVKLFADGVLLTRNQTALEVVKVGFEQFVARAAVDHGLLYGLATAMMALLTGWFASVVFRKD